MTRKRLSIAAASPLDAEPDASTLQHRDIATLERRDTTASQGSDPATLREKLTRKSLSHSSFYASPRVLKALRGIAVERDCKVNDLICEGLKIVLARDGLDFDALNRDA